VKILLTINWVERPKQPSPGCSVRSIGGRSGDFQWKHSEDQAISHIERGQFDYFVRKDAGNLKIKVSSAPDGHKFLAVNEDGKIPLCELNLPEHG
jgi:hypothetical protein